MIFRGSGVALVTPFTEDGIAFDTLEKLVEFQISNDTDALIAVSYTHLDVYKRQALHCFTISFSANSLTMETSSCDSCVNRYPMLLPPILIFDRS